MDYVTESRNWPSNAHLMIHGGHQGCSWRPAGHACNATSKSQALCCPTHHRIPTIASEKCLTDLTIGPSPDRSRIYRRPCPCWHIHVAKNYSQVYRTQLLDHALLYTCSDASKAAPLQTLSMILSPNYKMIGSTYVSVHTRTHLVRTCALQDYTALVVAWCLSRPRACTNKESPFCLLELEWLH